MTTNSFKVNTFNKLVVDNLNFINKLERKPFKSKKPGLRIFIPMHVISNHEFVSNIKNIEDVISLPDAIKVDRFRLKVSTKDDNIIYIYFPCNYKEYENLEFKKVKVECSILYDAANDESKKAYDKSIKK